MSLALLSDLLAPVVLPSLAVATFRMSTSLTFRITQHLAPSRNTTYACEVQSARYHGLSVFMNNVIRK
jgi:hypothetical protein